MDPRLSSEEQLNSQRELQRLRLELSDRDQQIRRLAEELDRQRSIQGESVSEQLNDRIERLFSDISLPMVQLLLQSYLYEQQGEEIHPKDLVSSIKRLSKTLFENSLEPVGDFGQVEAYNPDRHTPLSSASLLPEQPVRIRLVGMQYRGKILRKAIVEKAEV